MTVCSSELTRYFETAALWNLSTTSSARKERPLAAHPSCFSRRSFFLASNESSSVRGISSLESVSLDVASLRWWNSEAVRVGGREGDTCEHFF